MNITCKDLLELNFFQSCSLLTGGSGLGNIISFPSMSRSLSPDNLFLEHQFIIIADPVKPFTEPSLLSFIAMCAEHGISGILLFTDRDSPKSFHIPDTVISLAKEKELVLLEAPWDSQSSDMIRDISLFINGSRLRHNSLELILRNIFFFKNDEEEIQRLLHSDLHNSDYRLIRIQLFHFDEYCKQRNLTGEVQVYEQKMFLKRVLGNKVLGEYPGCPFCSHIDTLVLFCQKPDYSLRSIVKKLETIKDYMKSIFPKVDLRFCVSRVYTELRDISAAFHETFHLISLTNIEQFHDRIVTYSNIGIYQLFLSVRKDVLKENYRITMNPLLDYDEENGADLLSTLQLYLPCDCSIDETADRLFVHKNTIRYRLRKIEEIMDCDLKSSETITMLYYCLSINNYILT